MFDVAIGDHCQGTANQKITGVERVVFLGDSVTVGTPPTGGNQTYRAIVAQQLAVAFGIEAPSAAWESYNILNGDPIEQESGAFAQCSEWGARNDDLMSQMESCFQGEDFDQRTLVVMTSGGNDISAMTTDAIDGVVAGELFEQLESMVEFHRQAIDWLVEPDRFPNGVFVVNAHVFEFTDYTAEVLSCPTASIAGFNANPPNTDLLLGALNLINEEYVQIAADTGTDVAFMFETMCGHGFYAGQSDNVCFRGADAQNWFDGTCIHPTPTGHASVAEMFLSVITGE
jgi:lysophospholipase L1-like esterase